jgi:hypothetical protein
MRLRNADHIPEHKVFPHYVNLVLGRLFKLKVVMLSMDLFRQTRQTECCSFIVLLWYSVRLSTDCLVKSSYFKCS